MIEVDIMKLIQVHASKLAARLFRNNVAEAWVGVFVRRTPDGTVTLKNARPLHAGLCVGSADLIGWTKDGLFLAVEVKTETGQPTVEQINFITAVRAAGGRAGIARSIEDAEQIISGETST